MKISKIFDNFIIKLEFTALVAVLVAGRIMSYVSVDDMNSRLGRVMRTTEKVAEISSESLSLCHAEAVADWYDNRSIAMRSARESEIERIEAAAFSEQILAESIESACGDCSADEWQREVNAREMIAYATQFIGNEYVMGGSSLTEGTDCSGFTMTLYGKYGVDLPHSSASQAGYGTAVDGLENAQAGDLVVYRGHVAIYIGDGQIVHAANSSLGICISSVDFMEPVGFRRLL